LPLVQMLEELVSTHD